MKLTALEFEIMKHRLDVPDCIVESLTDNDDEEPGYCSDAIGNVIEYLQKQEIEESNAEYPATTYAVLKNCLEASTFVAATRNELDDAEGSRDAKRIAAVKDKLDREIRAGRSLAEKIRRRFGGSKIDFAVR